LSVPAVKAALHRGRERLRELSVAPTAPAPRAPLSLAAVRYAALFNARDWEGVRAMLADDVRLDVVSREKRAGRQNVGHYFTNYDRAHDWHLVPGWLVGREVLAVFRNQGDTRPGYFIELSLRGDLVAAIRDFRYVPYVGHEAEIVLAAAPEARP
jgi:RNA polymerase sigma-70 factor (ECF subfamily)